MQSINYFGIKLIFNHFIDVFHTNIHHAISLKIFNQIISIIDKYY